MDGTTSVAKGLSNAIAVVAMAPRGCLLNAWICIWTLLRQFKVAGKINIDDPIHKLKIAAEALGKVLRTDRNHAG